MTPWEKGKSLSAEHRRKISEGQKGRESGMLGKKHTEEAKQKIRSWRPTDEQRQKMSDAGKKRKLAKRHRENISEGLMGHVVSLETRRKISKTKIGVNIAEKHRQAIIAGMKARRTWVKRPYRTYP